MLVSKQSPSPIHGDDPRHGATVSSGTRASWAGSAVAVEPAAPSQPPQGGSSSAARIALLLAQASTELRTADDPDRILDIVVSSVLRLCRATTVWAGWKSPGGPLSHATIFDAASQAGVAVRVEGPTAGSAVSILEAILERFIPRLGTGHPPFDLDAADAPPFADSDSAGALTVFPLGSASRVGAVLVRAPCGVSRVEQSVISVLCDWARIALELVVATGEERRAKALSATLTRLTGSYSEADVILQTIVRATAEILEADAAYVMLVNDDRTRLTVRTAHGITRGSFYEMSISVDEMLPGAAIRDRRVKCVRDLGVHTQARYSRPEGLRSTICAPMFVRDELLGVLLAAHREVRDISPEDRRLMAALADAAAISIYNVRLLADREDSIRGLEEVSRLLAERSHAAERGVAFQRRLTELVLAGDGLEEMIGEITQTFGCAVLVLDGQLAILYAATAAGPQVDPSVVRDAIVQDRLDEDGSGFSRLHTGTADALIAPLQLGRERAGYVVVNQARGDLSSAEVAMIEAAVTAIGLRLMCDRSAAAAHARLTATLFDALVADRGEDAELARRAVQLGYDLSSANAAIAVLTGEPPDAEPAGRAGLRARIEAVIVPVAHSAFPVFEHDNAIFVVLSGPDEQSPNLVERQAALIQRELDCSPEPGRAQVAFAGPHDGVPGARRAIHEAALALRVGRMLGRAGEPQGFRDLGLWTLLGRVGEIGDLQTFAHGVIGALVAYDCEREMRLLETLRALAMCNFRYSSAANLMGVHPNTLRYRVSRIAELTKLDFGLLDDRLRAEIALRIFDSVTPSPPGSSGRNGPQPVAKK